MSFLNWVIFGIGMAQCVLVAALYLAGLRLRQKARAAAATAHELAPDVWPRCAMIIPLGAPQAQTEAALVSLLQQDYPDYRVYIVTQTGDARSENLIATLAGLFSNVEHVVAPIAHACGQKNQNLLTAVQAVHDQAEVLVFCDSTHLAQPDFLRCLVLPLIAGKADFATGYHQVLPRDQGIFTLGYTLCVLFMRLMQSLGSLTQPWGGAMAIRFQAFAAQDIGGLWQDNVVDDCALAGHLAQKHLQARLSPGALLDTVMQAETFAAWQAWLVRQILFLKFCMPGQWIALGALCLGMILPPVWCGICLLLGLGNLAAGLTVVLAFCWLLPTAWFVTGWRALIPVGIYPSRWFTAFLCACGMFFLCYCKTLFAKHIVWQGIEYTVGAGGKVTAMRKLS